MPAIGKYFLNSFQFFANQEMHGRNRKADFTQLFLTIRTLMQEFSGSKNNKDKQHLAEQIIRLCYQGFELTKPKHPMDDSEVEMIYKHIISSYLRGDKIAFIEFSRIQNHFVTYLKNQNNLNTIMQLIHEGYPLLYWELNNCFSDDLKEIIESFPNDNVIRVLYLKRMLKPGVSFNENALALLEKLAATKDSLGTHVLSKLQILRYLSFKNKSRLEIEKVIGPLHNFVEELINTVNSGGIFAMEPLKIFYQISFEMENEVLIEQNQKSELSTVKRMLLSGHIDSLRELLIINLVDTGLNTIDATCKAYQINTPSFTNLNAASEIPALFGVSAKIFNHVELEDFSDIIWEIPRNNIETEGKTNSNCTLDH